MNFLILFITHSIVISSVCVYEVLKKDWIALVTIIYLVVRIAWDRFNYTSMIEESLKELHAEKNEFLKWLDERRNNEIE